MRALHLPGVPIVAGSDQGVPGHTLHRELELYGDAGFTPLDALATATSTPARVMGAAARTGALASGLDADVVLVDGRPDESIRALRNVRLVIRRGVVFDPARLWRSIGFEP